MAREALIKWLRGRIAALRGTRPLTVLFVLSRVLRSVRLALHPARSLNQSFPRKLLAALLLLSCSIASANDFNLTDLNGKTHKLADYKGKWVLVNLWATWCPPCLEEIPDLIALQDSHKDLVVIGVAVDYESKKKVTDFADDNLMTYPIVLGDVKTMQQIGSPEVLPSTFFYNPQGKLVKLHRGLITRKIVEKLMR